MIPFKNNIPTMLGISKDADHAIAAALKSDTSLEDAVTRLSWHFKIRIRFDHPLQLRKLKGFKTNSTHTFSRFFVSENGHLCYAPTSRGKWGHRLPLAQLGVEYLELLRNNHEFKSYDEFKARFDPRFIKEVGIQSLWNSKSSQHGGQYNRGDFKKLGKQGKRLMKRFLQNFTNIDTVPSTARERSGLFQQSNSTPIKVYSEKHHTDHRLGRDISISYQSNSPYLYYSSEYMGCGNGDYGLIVNESTYLYLERD